MKRLLNLAGLAKRPKPPVGTTPADVVHRENKWRLLRYRRPEGAAGTKVEPTFDTPVLLVPSLINRHYVMDLLPGKSMAEDLVKMGHDVYCLDWGTPGDEDRFLSFDDICDRYLGRAIRHVAKNSPRGKAHVLGYCLGGTLATIHAAVHQEHVASLLLLAAPVSFGDSDGLLNAWTRIPTFDVRGLANAFGNIPWQLLQSAFQLLRPTLNMSKTVHLIDRAENDEFLDGFLALETWGNDNVSFPGECYVRYIEELYRNDALARGTFTLSGKPALLSNIECPTMCVVFEHDNIVPWQSASTLLERIRSKDKELLKLPGGHVGAVVSKAAQKKLWPKLSAYWANRDQDAPAEKAEEPRPVPLPVVSVPTAKSAVKAISPSAGASATQAAASPALSAPRPHLPGSSSSLTPVHAAFPSALSPVRTMSTTPALAYAAALASSATSAQDATQNETDDTSGGAAASELASADTNGANGTPRAQASGRNNNKKKKHARGRARSKAEADR